MAAFVKQERNDIHCFITFCISQQFSLPASIVSSTIEYFQQILILGDQYISQRKSLTESSLRNTFLNSELQKITAELTQEKEDLRSTLMKSQEKELRKVIIFTKKSLEKVLDSQSIISNTMFQM